MRIAFYAPMKPPDHPVPSGDRRVARLILAALALAGHEVRIASRLRSWTDGTSTALQDAIERRGRGIADALLARWRLPATPWRPDAWFTYHLYHKAPDWIGPTVARGLGLPYVVAEASYAPRQAGGPWDRGLKASSGALAQADAVFAVTGVDAAGLRAVLPDPERLHRLPPFLDATPFRAARARRAELRAKWFGDDPGPWLIAVGMMRPGDKQASYEVLAAALARLGDRPWNLALVGGGPAESAIRSRFDRTRLRVFGIRPPDSVTELLVAADLFVWPAVNEAYGMAVLEAQAAGLAVVAGNGHGVPDLVLDGRTGLLVPERDDAAFAAAVAELLGDPGRRRAIGEAAAARVAEAHDLPGAARTLDRVLRELALP